MEPKPSSSRVSSSKSPLLAGALPLPLPPEVLAGANSENPLGADADDGNLLTTGAELSTDTKEPREQQKQ
jgi:hypothetical protein